MAAVDNVQSVQLTGESKSARKKKAKAEAAAVNGTSHAATAVPEEAPKDDSAAGNADGSAEHPYLKELQKHIRNINKKLSSMHKLDAIIAENPGVSLDDLVTQRKINNDQKAAALKKPQMQAQLADLEERQEHYRKIDSDYQAKFDKQKEEFTSRHQQDLDRIREELRGEATTASAAEQRKNLLVFSQFLRAAAAKRTIEEEMDTDESRAFEGALLLVYGGDQKAVEAAVNLIEGSDEQVPSIEGIPTSVTYAQVKKASLDHAPFQSEEAWVDQVAEATSGEAPAEPETVAAASDPTITHAGLTELDETVQSNGITTETVTEFASAAPVSAGDAGNLASERWDDATGAGAEKGSLEEGYEIIQRPSEEVDVPVTIPSSGTAPQAQSTNWADEPTQEAVTGIGNKAGEKWDVKAPGEQAQNSWADASTEAAATDDGFSEVPGRTRGRGGHRGRGADGEFRGRGGRRGNFRGRGDGEYRGRGGFRGNRGDGEFRGGRGRGRGGPRGGGDSTAARA